MGPLEDEGRKNGDRGMVREGRGGGRDGGGKRMGEGGNGR